MSENLRQVRPAKGSGKKSVIDAANRLLFRASYPLVGISVITWVTDACASGTEGEAHHAATIESLIWPFANFLLYAALMGYLYKKFIAPALVARTTTFEQQLNNAASVLEDAERELRRADNRMRNIETEHEEIRQRLAADGEQMASRIKAHAEETAAQIKRDLVRRIARETSQAQHEVRQEVIRRATDRARDVLARGISGEQDRKLREEALKRLTA